MFGSLFGPLSLYLNEQVCRSSRAKARGTCAAHEVWGVGWAAFPPFSSTSANCARPAPKTSLRTRGCGDRCLVQSPRSLSLCDTLGKTQAGEIEEKILIYIST